MLRTQPAFLWSRLSGVGARNIANEESITSTEPQGHSKLRRVSCISGSSANIIFNFIFIEFGVKM